MSNWTLDKVVFKNNEGSYGVEKLCSAIPQSIKNGKDSENRLWIKDLFKNIGIKVNKDFDTSVYIEGVDIQNDMLILYSRSSWFPCLDSFMLIARCLNLKHAVLSSDYMTELYVNTDINYEFFDNEYSLFHRYSNEQYRWGDIIYKFSDFTTFKSISDILVFLREIAKVDIPMNIEYFAELKDYLESFDWVLSRNERNDFSEEYEEELEEQMKQIAAEYRIEHQFEDKEEYIIAFIEDKIRLEDKQHELIEMENTIYSFA